MKYDKVIIWGHPLYSHTHSYVHEAYFKAFSHLGYETHWFDDKDYPVDFDYSNSLFIGEGFADHNIPLEKTSAYYIMYCPSPKKYIEAGVDRYIDVRMAGFNFSDHVHNYSVDKTTLPKVGPGCYFDAKKDISIHYKNDHVDYTIEDFDKLYISWATNLLPHEFDESWIRLPREDTIYFCGNLSPNGVCENYSTFKPFIDECSKNGIKFVHNDSWSNPLSSSRVIELTQKSFLGIDIRGPEHLKQGLFTCRISKNISYGHLGLTNSQEIYNELEGHCILNTDTRQLFHDGKDHKEDYRFISDCMRYVKDNHTYVNRINSILSIL